MAVRVGPLDGQRLIAVDGKSLRGAAKNGVTMPHLLGALHHDAGVVAGQLAVDAKSNEILALPDLLPQLDLTDTS